MLQIWNKVSPILWFLQPGEYHLSPRNVLHKQKQKQKQKTKELGHVWFIKVTTKRFNAYTHTKRIYLTQMHILAPMKNRSLKHERLKHERQYSQNKINYLQFTLSIAYTHMQGDHCILYWVDSYLFGVQQVIIQCLFLPIHSHVLVSSWIGVPRSCTRLPSEQSIQIGTWKFRTVLYTTPKLSREWRSQQLSKRSKHKRFYSIFTKLINKLTSASAWSYIHKTRYFSQSNHLKKEKAKDSFFFFCTI